MEILRVRVAECAIALPHVLRLGSTEITTRDYVVIRVETSSGEYGEALGYPRGTPLFETASQMARQIMGEDTSMRREIMHSLELRNVPGRAALTRGLSLFDIALWDIACKRAGQPLFRYLGGLRQQVEITAVAGYYMDQRSIDDIVDEVAGLCDEGYWQVKIMLKGDDAVFDRKYASSVIERVPKRVAVDAHWSWTTLTEARRLCAELDGMGLNFIEDPFAANDVSLTHQLQSELKTQIAAGEDVYGAHVFSDLVRGIGILRVDATTCGGVTGAVEAINIAAAAGRTVLPHVFSPLHVHLACSFPNVEGAELIPETSGADPLQRLLLNCPAIKDGKMMPNEEPGVGIQVDWEMVERSARRVAVITSQS